jgi:tetratricopeptide (TPR) repeat protein
LAKAGQREKALDYLDSALAINKDAVDAWTLKAEILAALGRRSASKACAAQARKLEAAPDRALEAQEREAGQTGQLSHDN